MEFIILTVRPICVIIAKPGYGKWNHDFSKLFIISSKFLNGNFDFRPRFQLMFQSSSLFFWGLDFEEIFLHILLRVLLRKNDAVFLGCPRCLFFACFFLFFFIFSKFYIDFCNFVFQFFFKTKWSGAFYIPKLQNKPKIPNKFL